MINGARGIRTLDRQRPGLIPKIGWYPAKLDDSPPCLLKINSSFLNLSIQLIAEKF